MVSGLRSELGLGGNHCVKRSYRRYICVDLQHFEVVEAVEGSSGDDRQIVSRQAPEKEREGETVEVGEAPSFQP